MRGLRMMIAAAAAAALSVIAAPAPALADAGELTLGIYWHNTGATKTVSLTCDPVGGTHPDAEDACADLTKADGDISRIPHTGASCPPLYDPVTVFAFGTWNGRSVFFAEEHTNDACANVATGGNVFNF
ncbi:SSI family serine proteinase inhibitor [Thermomonospora catenispora]|uniref:SSI family serine proteinase inhibitor n=1 Tax=Thermomonospora catenispora TaxID=2493090 RepID=UPI0013754B9F|nr:SSI family serine proteinase inhibitor [Thermomonospora catenispora]